LLAFSYAVLLAWHLAFRAPHSPASWILISSRFLLAAAVAGLLLSPIRLSTWGVRAFEAALFGGLTILVVVSLYVVNLSMLAHGGEIAMVAFMKNGVIQMVVLMLLYGTFIPNRTRTVVWAVLGMALAPLSSLALLAARPELAPLAGQLRTA